MKKLLMGLGVLFLVLVVLAGLYVGYAMITGSHLDQTSKAYVDESVPAIVGTWSKEELLKRAAPEMLKAIPEDQMDRVLAKLSQLGKMTHYDGSKGDATIVITGRGMIVTAAYHATATFEKGTGNITIRLVQHDGQWQIAYFHVDSPLFLN